MKCPLCGSKVTYEGLTSLACTGLGCQNWDKTSNALPAIGTIWYAAGYSECFIVKGYHENWVLVASTLSPTIEVPIKWDLGFWTQVS